MPDNPSFDVAAFSDRLSTTVAEAAERVVAVYGPRQWPASGLLWRPGLVVAAEETLQGEEDLSITLPRGETVEAEIVGRDPSTDIVLLRAETGEAPEWRLAPMPRVGAMALAVGRTEESPVAAFGIVTAVGGPWQSLRGGRIDARISLDFTLPARAEGGAAVLADGSLIGLAVTGPRRRTIVIPATTVERVVTILLDKGYVARGYLGVSLQRVGRRGGQHGLVVMDVEPESPAQKAGFVVGDIITTWNGEPVRRPGDVARGLGPDTVGQDVVVGVLRGGVASEITVTIGERPRR